MVYELPHRAPRIALGRVIHGMNPRAWLKAKRNCQTDCIQQLMRSRTGTTTSFQAETMERFAVSTHRYNSLPWLNRTNWGQTSGLLYSSSFL